VCVSRNVCVRPSVFETRMTVFEDQHVVHMCVHALLNFLRNRIASLFRRAKKHKKKHQCMHLSFCWRAKKMMKKKNDDRVINVCFISRVLCVCACVPLFLFFFQTESLFLWNRHYCDLHLMRVYAKNITLALRKKRVVWKQNSMKKRHHWPPKCLLSSSFACVCMHFYYSWGNNTQNVDLMIDKINQNVDVMIDTLMVWWGSYHQDK